MGVHWTGFFCEILISMLRDSGVTSPALRILLVLNLGGTLENNLCCVCEGFHPHPCLLKKVRKHIYECSHVCGCIQRPEESTGSSWAAVRGDSESFNHTLIPSSRAVPVSPLASPCLTLVFFVYLFFPIVIHVCIRPHSSLYPLLPLPVPSSFCCSSFSCLSICSWLTRV